MNKKISRLSKRAITSAILFYFILFSVHICSSAPGEMGLLINMHYERAVMLYKQGNYEVAIRELERVLEIDPAHSNARKYLSAATKRRNKKVIDQLYVKANAFHKQKQYQKALDVYNKVLEIAPNDGFSLYQIELLSAKIEKIEKMKQNELKYMEKQRAKELEKFEKEKVKKEPPLAKTAKPELKPKAEKQEKGKVETELDLIEDLIAKKAKEYQYKPEEAAPVAKKDLVKSGAKAAALDMGAGEGIILDKGNISVDNKIVATKDNLLNISNKVLTSPVISNSPNATGATWIDLGKVGTAEIAGGKIDGVTIGGLKPDKGTFTTLQAEKIQIADSSASISQDDSNNLIFTDTVTGTKTLAQLSEVAKGRVSTVAGGNGLISERADDEVILDIGSGEGIVVNDDNIAVDTKLVATADNVLTMSYKVLSSPIISDAPSAKGATWTDLGNVESVAIKGGSLDNTTIGSIKPAAGTFTKLNTISVNSPGNSFDALSLSGRISSMDGQDTFRGIYVGYDNTQHNGSHNYIFGMHVDKIKGDKNAVELGLLLEDGWDYQLALRQRDGNKITAFRTQQQEDNITYTLPNTAGKRGEVLTANGGGYLSWSPVKTFTGPHYYFKADPDLEPGELVKLDKRMRIARSDKEKDPTVIGIYWGVPGSQNEAMKEGKSFAVICQGDSYIEDSLYPLKGAWVCDEGGEIKEGDLLCSAKKNGYLKKQEDNIVYSYTVAKAVTDIKFDEDGTNKSAYVLLMQ